MLAYGSWALMCVVLAGSYSSQILGVALSSSVTIPFTDVSSLARCVRDRDCVLTAKTTSNSYYEAIFTATRNPFLELRKAVAENPILVHASSETVGVSEELGGKALPVAYTTLGRYLRYAAVNPPCTFAWVKVQSFDPFTFPFAFNSSYKQEFDRAIVKLRQYGIVGKIAAKYSSASLASEAMCYQSDGLAHPMPVRAYYGLFYLLPVGSLLGLLALGLEKKRKIH